MRALVLASAVAATALGLASRRTEDGEALALIDVTRDDLVSPGSYRRPLLAVPDKPLSKRRRRRLKGRSK